MSTLSLRLPGSLHRKVRELAEADDVSINQFIATAVAEKTAALLTVDYLEARGGRANRALVERVLARMPDVASVSGDERHTPRQPDKAVQPTSRARKVAKSLKRTRAVRG